MLSFVKADIHKAVKGITWRRLLYANILHGYDYVNQIKVFDAIHDMNN